MKKSSFKSTFVTDRIILVEFPRISNLLLSCIELLMFIVRDTLFSVSTVEFFEIVVKIIFVEMKQNIRDFAFFVFERTKHQPRRNLRSYLVLQRLCNEAALSPGIDAFWY